MTLGKTGIKTSRLAMGTGTVGYAKHSNQTALGVAGLSALLLNGYDHGLRFFDAADSYGSHPHVAAALKQLPRDKVTVMTKSPSRTPQEMRADLDRYRKELGTDYLDIVLMHCMTEGDWTERFKGTMDVLSEAKQKGIIRAHGCSCHTIEALRAAAKSPWVEVDLVRINPIGSHMDADPATVVSVMQQMKSSGKGHYRDEDPRSGRPAQPPERGHQVRAVAESARRLHHRRRKQERAGQSHPARRRGVGDRVAHVFSGCEEAIAFRF